MRYPDSALPIAVGATNVSSLSSIVDTRGFRYAKIACVAVPEVALASTAGSNKLSESDDGYTFTDIDAAKSGTGFTPSSSVGPSAKPLVSYEVDLRGRKRFLKVDFATAATTQPMILAQFDGGEAFNNPAPVLGGIYGGERTRQFVRDAIRGDESLDVIVVGDSNVGHENYGWTDGIPYALRTLGASVYSSPLLPGATGGAGAASLFPGLSYGYDGTNTGRWQTSEAALGNKGSGEDYPEINDFWNANGGTLLWSSAAYWDWMYIDATATSLFAQIIAATTAAMPITAEHIWRLGVATFDTGSGELNLGVYNGTSGAAVVTDTFSSNTGTTGFQVYEMTVPADPARNFGLRFRPYAVGPVSPAGVLWMSVYQRRTGFACQPYHYGGGQDLREIGNACGNSAMMRTFLAELRARQIAAGGRGRVLVFINGGVNEVATPSDWPEGSTAVYEGFRSAWSQLGYPESDLAFLAGVSHQRASTDDLAPHRALAKAWVADKPSATVYDLAEQSLFDVLNNQTLLKDAGLVHMYTGGYQYCALRMMASLANDAIPTTTVRL
jgi:hypothetical protein